MFCDFCSIKLNIFWKNEPYLSRQEAQLYFTIIINYATIIINYDVLIHHI